MATTVDTLLVRIEADMTDLKRSLRKVETDVDKSSKKISGSMNKIGVAIKGAIAGIVVQQAVRGGAAMVNLASDIEEMQGKSAVVFGQFRDQVVKDLEDFGDAVGRSTFELEGMAASIQDTFVPMGFARGAAANLSVELTKLAVDVASFNNASDVDTMRAFQSALVGNHETVRQFGVIITQVTLDQELMRMGIEKGTKTATEAQKVQARMNLIIRGTSDAHGDAARTAGSFANQSRALTAQLSELAGELGTLLLPAVTDIVAALIRGTTATKEFLFNIGLLSRYTSDVGGLAGQIKDLEASIESLRDKAESQDFISGFFVDYEFAIEGQQRLLDTLKEKHKKAIDEIAASNREARLNDLPLTTSGNSSEDNTETEFDKQAEKIQKITAATKRLGVLQNDLRVAERSGNKASIKEARIALEIKKLESQFTELSPKNLRMTAEAIVDNAIAQEQYAESLKTTVETAKELTPMIQSLTDSVSSMSQGISNSFSEMLMSGKMNLDSLKDVFRSFVKVIIAKAIELFFVNKILNAIFGGFGGTPLPTASFPGLAGGGSVSPNQPYMVGERGPELFVPSSAGTVMNNSNSKGFGGGSTTVVNQTINVSAGVSQTVRAEMISLLPSFKQETMSGVADAKRRGGSYGRAFG